MVAQAAMLKIYFSLLLLVVGGRGGGCGVCVCVCVCGGGGGRGEQYTSNLAGSVRVLVDEK